MDDFQAGAIKSALRTNGAAMSTVQRYQLDLQYKGRSISVIVAPMLEGAGWGWATLIDQTEAIKHKGRAFETPELAMADGKANVEAYIDSCDAA